MAIGCYADPGLTDLDAQARAGRLVDLLAPFGGRHLVWAHPARERGADAVQRRLRDWSRPADRVSGSDRVSGRDRASGSGSPAGPAVGLPTESVLYWAGHGWSDAARTATRAALAHAASPATVGCSGVAPPQLAQAIAARQAAIQPAGQCDEAGGWALVVLDTSNATQIADAVMAALHGPDAPRRLLLVAVPPEAAPGGFPDVLAGLLADAYRGERRILLRDLAGQLERVLGPGNVYQRDLGEAALTRIWPPAAWMSAPADAIDHLEEVLAALSPDERSHFVAKARGGEHGEQSWFFEGRQQEIATISAWLRRPVPGMLVVAGRAGSGKSALLGQVLALSLPGLRDALARRGLITLPDRDVTPPNSVFNVVIHLRGLTLQQATRRVAAAAGLDRRRLPSATDRALGVINDLDWLAGQLAARDRMLTILADALDEAADPLDIAGSLLARIAALPRVRVLAGTRASIRETPDHPAADRNVVAALAAGDGIVRVTRDGDAIARYVAARLRHARDHGADGHAIAGLAPVRDADINRAAAAVAARDREFLYARLAVYELIADPSLLRPGRAASLGGLLGGDHQDLFAKALDRLGRLDDHYLPLIQALSLARGRGLPEADGIWAAVAASLGPPAEPAAVTEPAVTEPAAVTAPARRAWAHAIRELLRQAAAYITVDTTASASGRTTVYRLAHQALTECLTRARDDLAAHRERQRRAATSLLGLARQVAVADPAGMPEYLIRHLSGHVADAGLWDDLAADPGVLDGLDPAAVTADALRTLFGRGAIPPPVAGVIGARDELLAARPADRAGLRQLASTTHSPQHVTGEPCRGWGIAAAQAGQVSMHLRLTGHTAIVCKVCAVPLPDGRTVVASASDDGTIRLWDVRTAAPIGAPLTGHTGTVEDVCVVPMEGQTMLASAGGDGTVRMWDPVTARPVGQPLTGHVGPVFGVCSVPRPDGRSWVASSGGDGTIRVWDPVTGRPAGQPLAGHVGAVGGVCTVPAADGRTWLASAGADATVRVWDPVAGQQVGRPLTGHVGHVFTVCLAPRADGRYRIASGGTDGTIRLWDPVTGWTVGDPLVGHVSYVRRVCAVLGVDGRTWIASGGADGTVRVWDAAAGRPVGDPLVGHAGPVVGLCTVPGADGRTWIASGGADGTVRVWDPAASYPIDQSAAGHVGPMFGVCTLPGTGGRTWIASGGADGTVRVWDPAAGRPVGQPLAGHTGPMTGLCTVAGTDGRTWIASGGTDGSVRVWDPATSRPVGEPLTGHAGSVAGVCAVPGAEGRTRIASCGRDGTIRIWDPVASGPVGGPLADHTGPVFGICTLPGTGGRTWIASCGADGVVRVWDSVVGRPVGEPLTGHADAVRGLCTVPGTDGRTWIASGGTDGTVRVWDPVAGRPVGEPLTGHTGPVAGVCVMPGAEGRSWIASAGMDGMVRVWDPVAGRPVGEPLGTSLASVAALQPVHAADAACAVVHSSGHLQLWDPATATLTPVATPARHVSAFTELTTTTGTVRVVADTAGQVTRVTASQNGDAATFGLSGGAVLSLMPVPGRAGPAGLRGSRRDHRPPRRRNHAACRAAADRPRRARPRPVPGYRRHPGLGRERRHRPAVGPEPPQDHRRAADRPRRLDLVTGRRPGRRAGQPRSGLRGGRRDAPALGPVHRTPVAAAPGRSRRPGPRRHPGHGRRLRHPAGLRQP